MSQTEYVELIEAADLLENFNHYGDEGKNSWKSG